jgi:hypothetical protein
VSRFGLKVPRKSSATLKTLAYFAAASLLLAGGGIASAHEPLDASRFAQAVP